MDSLNPLCGGSMILSIEHNVFSQILTSRVRIADKIRWFLLLFTEPILCERLELISRKLATKFLHLV